MSIYSDKLVHVQVVINCRYSVAQLCTHEDTLAYLSGALSIDDLMSYNLLTTNGINLILGPHQVPILRHVLIGDRGLGRDCVLG